MLTRCGHRQNLLLRFDGRPSQSLRPVRFSGCAHLDIIHDLDRSRSPRHSSGGSLVLHYICGTLPRNYPMRHMESKSVFAHLRLGQFLFKCPLDLIVAGAPWLDVSGSVARAG